jgi:hypothetical protein
MHHDTGRNGRFVTVRHGFRNGLGNVQDIQEGKGLLSPKALAPIADARIVAQSLTEGAPIQPLQDKEAYAIAGGPGAQEVDNVFVMQSRMHHQLTFNFVNGQRHILTFRFEGFNDHWLAVVDRGMDPTIAPVRQVLDVGELPPLQIQGRPGNGYFFQTLVPNDLLLHTAVRGGNVLRARYGRGIAWGAIVRIQTRGGQGIDRSDAGRQGHVHQEFHRGRSHNDSADKRDNFCETMLPVNAHSIHIPRTDAY